MTAALDPAAIGRAFLGACRAELTALKPGNVHVHAGGHRMEVAQFERAADAAAQFIADPGLSFGGRVLGAVEASMAAAGCNTNLGIVLLSAPLAAAAMLDAGSGTSLAGRIAAVLAALDRADARDVYAAIRRANPGGLGKSEAEDVAEPPGVGLVEAMRMAAPRDRIAAAYAFGFRDIIEDHVPMLRRLDGLASATGAPRDDVVATLYMSLLSRFPDSHIRRKFGFETAAHVQALAKAARPDWNPMVRRESHAALLALDETLKVNGWNPGTTADFTVATLFASDLAQEGGFSLLSNVAS